MSKPNSQRLLQPSDCSPVEWLDREASSSVALICEHAGNAVPLSLHNLGLSDSQLQEHTAIDIGAEPTARHLANQLGCPLLMQRYSRLVIDCNRPTNAQDSIPEVSHGVPVPANQSLDEQQRKARIDEIFAPYDDALGTLLAAPERRFAFSIHSFTPTLGEFDRPWDIGLLFRHDSDTSAQLSRFLTQHHPDLTVGLNQPYQIDDESDWFVPRHAEPRKLHHSLIEIRNDHIQTPAGQERMATILAAAIQQITSRTGS